MARSHCFPRLCIMVACAVACVPRVASEAATTEDLVAQCPAGAYMSPSEHAERSSRLARYFHALQQQPDVAPPLDDALSYMVYPSWRAPTSGHMVYESPTWPKPHQCRRSAMPFLQPWKSPHTYAGFCAGPKATNYGCNPPVAYSTPGCPNVIVSDGPFPFVVAGAYKAGILSWEGGLMSCCKLEAAMVSTYNLLASGYTSRGEGGKHLAVGFVRDPLARFLSGMQEVYHRMLPDVRPDVTPAARRRRSVVAAHRRGTLHYRHLAAAVLSAPPGSPPTGNALREFVEAYVNDTVCGLNFPEAPHTRSQATFFPPGFHPDVVYKTEQGNAAYDDFFSLLHPEWRTAAEGDWLRQCREESFGHKHSASDKPPDVPSKAALLEAVRQAGLVRELCRVFVVDYVCFDYALPAECEGLV